MNNKTIIKRSGKEEPINIGKIIKVLQEADPDENPELIREIALESLSDPCPRTTEELRVRLEELLIQRGCKTMARNYVVECYKNEEARKKRALDKSILGLISQSNQVLMNENANKNPKIISTQRDLIAGEINKDIVRRYIIPEEVMEAHDRGVIHIHDMDYSAQPMTNCCLINLEDMLQNGTSISGVKIEKPKSLRTAATVMTQISAAVASAQYGGQSISLSHLAPFVDISRNKIREELKETFAECGLSYTEEELDKIAENRLRKEIKDSVQTMQYQWSTLSSTNGQSPFITLFMYLGEAKNEREKEDLAILIEEVFVQRMKGVKNRQGFWVTPTFPKLIYVLEEENIEEGQPYYYLTKLASKCIAKRMAPDLISEKVMKRLKQDKNGEGYCYPAMGCRSFLSLYEDPATEKQKLYGRFNMGVVSINLPYIAYESRGNLDRFWELLDHYSSLVFKAHMARVNNLRTATADVAPILWRDGALARLQAGEPIEKLFYNGYATISLGYMGIYECVRYLTGLSHTDERAKDFALSIMRKLDETCEDWKNRTRLAFAVYGTPAESLTDKFSNAIKRDFDPGFKDWVTNSFHVDVEEEINAFDKLSFEADFQNLSPGGSITYIEVPSLIKNTQVIETLMKHIYENVMYSEINTKLDVCGNCGFEGEIELIEGEDGEYFWECPNCLNRDVDTMSIVRRVCGYLGDASNGINHGRLADIKHRALHL